MPKKYFISNQKTVVSLRAEGLIFQGVLFAGFMITRDGPIILEFNCRFGDPETQSVLPLLKTNLFDIMVACMTGTLSSLEIEWQENQYCCTVVCSAAGYPSSNYEKQLVIYGLDDEIFCKKPVKAFHYQTMEDPLSHEILNNSGRVLGICGTGEDLASAISLAYEAVDKISFRGMHFRKDIGKK